MGSSKDVEIPKGWAKLWADQRFDILLFCRIMNFEPHPEQVKMLLLFQEITLAPPGKYADRRGITKAGTGTGKTAGIAICALWALFRNADTRVIATAVTKDQVRTVFMREVRKHLHNAPAIVFQMVDIHATKVHIKKNPDWCIESLIAKTAVSTQGRHARHQFVLAEEVSEIPSDILEAFLGTLTEEHNVFYAIGNPNFRSGLLYRAFNGKKKFWPNRTTMNKLALSKSHKKKFRNMAPPDKIEQIRLEYGEDHDQWRVRVLGEFPLGGDSSAISLDSLERATKSDWKVAAAINSHVQRIAIDVARYGADETCIGVRLGNALVQKEEHQGKSTTWTADRAYQLMLDFGLLPDETLFIVDGVGSGAGVVDRLRDVYECQVFEFGSHRIAPDEKYGDMGSMAWGNTADILDRQIVYLGSDETMQDQLSQRDYYVKEDDNNRYFIESKAEYKKRAGESPDRADMVVMAFYDGVDDLGPGEVWSPARDSAIVQKMAEDMAPEEQIVEQPLYQPLGLSPYANTPYNLFGR